MGNKIVMKTIFENYSSYGDFLKKIFKNECDLWEGSYAYYEENDVFVEQKLGVYMSKPPLLPNDQRFFDGLKVQSIFNSIVYQNDVDLIIYSSSNGKDSVANVDNLHFYVNCNEYHKCRGLITMEKGAPKGTLYISNSALRYLYLARESSGLNLKLSKSKLGRMIIDIDKHIEEKGISVAKSMTRDIFYRDILSHIDSNISNHDADEMWKIFVGKDGFIQ
jgi:hypothetical protein